MATHKDIARRFLRRETVKLKHNNMSSVYEHGAGELRYYSQVFAWRRDDGEIFIESRNNIDTVRGAQAWLQVWPVLRGGTVIDSFWREFFQIPLSKVIGDCPSRKVTRYATYTAARGVRYHLVVFPFSFLEEVFEDVVSQDLPQADFFFDVAVWVPESVYTFIENPMEWLTFLAPGYDTELLLARLKREPSLMVPGGFLIGDLALDDARRKGETFAHWSKRHNVAFWNRSPTHTQHIAYRNLWANEAMSPRKVIVDTRNGPVYYKLSDLALMYEESTDKDTSRHYLTRRQDAARWWEMVGWQRPVYTRGMALRGSQRLGNHDVRCYYGTLPEAAYHTAWQVRRGPCELPLQLEQFSVISRLLRFIIEAKLASEGDVRELCHRSFEWSESFTDAALHPALTDGVRTHCLEQFLGFKTRRSSIRRKREWRWEKICRQLYLFAENHPRILPYIPKEVANTAKL